MRRARASSTSAFVSMFALAIFSSAFLIFLVQPMVGKHILPWFGGAPGVWTLCLAFYQTSLFVGYAYAHGLVRFVRAERQVWLHATLFAAALMALPVLPDASWRPTPDQDPSTRILAMLTQSVALPFVVLAATGPLLQAWFARALPGRSPYPLYAVSNAGSLLALVAYPLLVEPSWTVSLASQVWTWAFFGCGMGVLATGWLAARPFRESGADRTPDDPAHAPGQPIEARLDPNVTAMRIALWIALPASAVVLLMGVTNQLCLDVASVPFLWVVPLALYLVSFIVCFSSERTHQPGVMLTLAAATGGLIALSGAHALDSVSGVDGWRALPVQIVLYSGLLFSGCMLMHGELYRQRPPARALTLFYLCVSGGGALGGLFVGIGAPRLFDEYLELPLGLLACWSLFLLVRWQDSTSPWRTRRLQGVSAVVATLGLLAIGVLGRAERLADEDLILQQRNFFGVLRVSETHRDEPRRHQRTLWSGHTLHGTQLQNPRASRRPTAYYGVASGIGLALRSRPVGEASRVGVVGLGVGTLAAYGRDGDVFRFFEIDPDVIRIAQEDAVFSFVADSKARVEIVPGDARLSLEDESNRSAPRFEVLVVDAFSSDAIPVHLLTREALALYADRLDEAGLLAIHVSNVHLDLVPLVYRVGGSAGFRAITVRNAHTPSALSQQSTWVLLGRDAERLALLADTMRRRARNLGLADAAVQIFHPASDQLARTPVWSDDYSSLFGLLRRHSKTPRP